MNKKALSETDIRSKFITPALCGSGGAGWDLMTRIKEEAYFTKGRVIVRGKTVRRGEAKKADYLLYYKPNFPLAVLEAKDNNHSVADGMQQALFPEFFDLVVVDECHRGSAADDARWRQVLDYFSSATQIGMTATPKETKEISNIEYFGEPIYT